MHYELDHIMSESNEKKLDATGLFCPEPVFRTKIEIERMQVGQVLIVSADDPAAEEDISRWVIRNGHELLDLKKDGNTITFQIKKVK
ncbi:transcriptional regulator [Nitrosarchaeum sp.]|nr:transcriptional regulator [Nitrosarchaeum sp.]